MNLLELFIKIGVNDEATQDMEHLSVAMIAKANLISDAIKSAISTAIGSIKGLVESSISSFAQYEQNIGGIETFFGEAADSVINNAKNAYETAGMSANQYMSNVSSFAMSLINSVAQRRVQATRESTDEENAIQQAALDSQVTNLQNALSKQYSERQKAYSKEYSEAQKAYSKEYEAQSEALSEQLDAYRDMLSERLSEQQKALSKELSNLRKALAEQVSAQQEANAEALSAKRSELDASYDATQRSLDKEVEAFRKATDARIKEINREYKEKLKLLDDDEAAAIQELQNQIDALDAQTEAERTAQREREEQQRIADLRAAVANAETIEDKEKAQRDYDDYLADLEQEQRERERKAEKESIQDAIQAIRDEYAQKREAIKEEQETQVEEYRESRSEELSALQDANAAKLKKIKEANEKVLEQMRKDQEKQIEQMREANDEEIEQKEEANSKIIESEREKNEKLIKERQNENKSTLEQLKENQEQQLELLRDNQEQQLEQLKESQEQQLQWLRESVAEQKEILSDALSGVNETLEVTEEDRAEAARIADMAMQDMSDNANKMGTNMESIEAAYQGFAKQNFTMLDNLKLGYGGTSHEMQRLLADAENIKASHGEMATYSIDSFADIVEAIHVVQEEYGITGTTAEEGATTIEGAWNRVTAAFDNWLVALANGDGDVQEETEALVETAATAASLIIPRVADVLERLLVLVAEKAPEIWEQFKTAMYNALPDEWKEKWDTFTAAVDEFFKHFNEIKDALPVIEKAFIAFEGFKVLTTAVSGTITAFKGLKTLMSWFAGGEAVAGAAGGVEAAIGAAGGAALEGGAGGALASIGTAAESAAGGLGTMTAAAGEAAGAAGLGGLGATAGTVGGAILSSLGPTAIVMGPVAAIGMWMASNEELKQNVQDVANANDHNASVSFASMIENSERASTEMANHAYNGGNSIKESYAISSDESKESIKSLADSTKDRAKEIEEAFSGVSKEVPTSTGEIKKAISTDMSSIKTDVTVNTSAMADSWSTHLTNMKNNAATAASDIEVQTSGMSSSIKGNFDNSGTWLDTAGWNVLIGFYNGLVRAWNEYVVGFITDIGQWIIDHKGPEQYDKTLLTPAGEWIMQSLSDGLVNGFENDVKPYITSLASNVEGMAGEPNIDYTGSYGQMVSDAQDAGSSLRGVTEDTRTDVVDEMSAAMRELVSVVHSVGDELQVAGRNIMTSLYNGMVQMWNEVQAFVSNIGPWIADHKGPVSYDRKLLAPAGEAIMGGLLGGLEDSFENDVMPYVEDMADRMEDGFGSPQLSAYAASMTHNTAGYSATGRQRPVQQTVILELDRVQFGRLVYQLNDEEQRRLGVNLAGGFA